MYNKTKDTTRKEGRKTTANEATNKRAKRAAEIQAISPKKLTLKSRRKRAV
jgi:hypothetical protein